MTPMPTVGRIVHFYPSPEQIAEHCLANDGEPFAAVITRVWSEHCVNLAVFRADGEGGLGVTSVEDHHGSSGGRWCWPPRV